MKKTSLELTPAQQDISLEGRLFGKVVNNIGGYQVYRCDLDVPRFRRARDRLLRDHDAYLLRFDETDGGCEPFLSDASPAELPVVACATEASARSWVEARMATSFADLSTAVFEDALLRLDDGTYWYYAKAHHLVMDGWGFALQMQRLLHMYAHPEDAVVAEGDEAGGAPATPPSMVDYMRRQSEYRWSPQYARSRDYWLLRHEAAPAPLFPRQRSATAASARASTLLAPTLAASLRALAATAKSDLVVVMHAVLYVCFSRICQRRDIVIGSPVHNRRSAIDKAIIGSIVNVNMHRFDATPDLSFSALLERVAARLRQDHRHGRFPLGDLVRSLRAKSGAGDHASHDIGFNYQKLDFGLSLHGRPVETHFVSHGHERVPLTFVLCEYGGQDLRLHLDHALDCFDAAQARDVLDRVVHLMRHVAEDAARPIGAYPLLLPHEWRDQFVRWQGAEVPLLHGACLHEFFEKQARRIPEQVAAACGDASLTYADLDRHANRLAHRLIAQGIGRGDRVGVCHRRSLDLPIALLAVLKSGAAYVPIDPGYPEPRVRHILDDAQPAAVIADARGMAVLGAFDGVVFRTDDVVGAAVEDGPGAASLMRPATAPSAEDVAYVIYTSGSTGRPKGVQIEHRNAAAFVQWALAHHAQEDWSAVLAATSICFDLSIFEIFATLAAGGRIALVENVLSLRDQAIDGLTLINTVPSAIRSLLEADAVPRDVRCINLAGEWLHQDLVEALYARLPAAKVYDLYGPSETTTYSTVCLRTPGGDTLIGKPIHNTLVHVLDEAGEPLPSGTIGELHIGGAGLARGYLNQPALTAERFVHNRHAGARLYRTGDLARWMPDGSLQYRGRKDHQEKIRGFRIEPGEIEACLRDHPAVADCVVVGRDAPDGAAHRQLVAYVVAAANGAAALAGDALVEALGTFVTERLPVHAVPSRFALLAALPLTPNGKVDRAALPALADGPCAAASLAQPRDDTERRLAALWGETLRKEGIGIHDSFFSHGGDSLHFLRLASSIEREFGVRIELSLLFATPTIEAQARLIARHGAYERLRQAVFVDPRDARSDSFIDL